MKSTAIRLGFAAFACCTAIHPATAQSAASFVTHWVEDYIGDAKKVVLRNNATRPIYLKSLVITDCVDVGVAMCGEVRSSIVGYRINPGTTWEFVVTAGSDLSGRRFIPRFRYQFWVDWGPQQQQGSSGQQQAGQQPGESKERGLGAGQAGSQVVLSDAVNQTEENRRRAAELQRRHAEEENLRVQEQRREEERQRQLRQQQIIEQQNARDAEERAAAERRRRAYKDQQLQQLAEAERRRVERQREIDAIQARLDAQRQQLTAINDVFERARAELAAAQERDRLRRELERAQEEVERNEQVHEEPAGAEVERAGSPVTKAQPNDGGAAVVPQTAGATSRDLKEFVAWGMQEALAGATIASSYPSFSRSTVVSSQTRNGSTDTWFRLDEPQFSRLGVTGREIRDNGGPTVKSVSLEGDVPIGREAAWVHSFISIVRELAPACTFEELSHSTPAAPVYRCFFGPQGDAIVWVGITAPGRFQIQITRSLLLAPAS